VLKGDHKTNVPACGFTMSKSSCTVSFSPFTFISRMQDDGGL